MEHLETIDRIKTDLGEDYEISYYKQYLIDYDPEWLVELTEIKGAWVNDKLKLEMIFRVNHLEETIGSIPEIVKKLRDRYIYTPISKKEYIADMSLIEDYELYIIDSIIENMN